MVFGFQLSDNIDQTAISVSGSHITGSYITFAGNGVEDGQSKPTIIVFDNAYNEMTPPGGSIGVNTTPGATYITPVTIVITITFPMGTYTSADLDIANFNPFLIVNQNRGVEVHLRNFAPTTLADPTLFGTFHDDSDPDQQRYYTTTNNLPWAINIPTVFEYPVEKQDIVGAYLYFADWAESEGTIKTDWYEDQSGYRNDIKIYSPTIAK